MRLKFHDALINVHPKAENGRRTITIIFTEDGEQKIVAAGSSFGARLNEIEGLAGKALDVCQNEHGRFIVCEADDAILAEEEALDLKEMLASHVGLTAVIVLCKQPPHLDANSVG